MKKALSILLTLTFILLPCSVVQAKTTTLSDAQMQYVTYNVNTQEETYSYYNVEPPAELANSILARPGFTGTAPLDEPIESSISPRTVFGEDNRSPVTNYNILPYRAICYVNATFSDGYTGRSTGWLFSPDGAVVAGHAIYNPERGGWANTVVVYPARNNNNKPYTVEAYEFGLATPYAENQDANYDYGLLKLEQSIGNTVGYLGYTYNGGAVGNTIRVIGYPVNVTNQTATQYIQYESSGTIDSVYANRLYYNADATGGQSGAPLFLGNSNTVIGIHTHSSTNVNKGKRIHYDMYDWMNNW